MKCYDFIRDYLLDKDESCDVGETWRRTLSKIYYRLFLIFGTYYKEYLMVNNKLVDDSKDREDAFIPYMIPEINADTSIINYCSNLVKLIRLFFYATELYSKSPSNYRKEAAPINALFKKFDLYGDEKSNTISIHKVYETTTKKTPSVSQLFSVNPHGSITDFYYSLGNSACFLSQCKFSFDPNSKNYNEFKDSFAKVYDHYYSFIINEVPLLGDLNSIEQEFLKYILENIDIPDDPETDRTEQSSYTGKNPKRNRNRKFLNALKSDNWEVLEINVRETIIEYIDAIAACDPHESKAENTSESDWSKEYVLEDVGFKVIPKQIPKCVQELRTDPVPQYDYSRINKYLRVPSEDDVVFKLNRIREKLLTPKKFRLTELSSEIQDLIQGSSLTAEDYSDLEERLKKLKKDIENMQEKTGCDRFYIEQLDKLY